MGLSDRTLQLAMKAQEVALIFASRPGNYEMGMQAYKAAQKIIDRWDRQQLETMRGNK